MWGYINKISSLEEKASAQVAISLCQENGFKDVALRLEMPTYGSLIDLNETSFFVSDPEKLSKWAKVKEDDRLRHVLMSSCYLDDTEKKVSQWDTAIDEQCQRLTERIPLPNRLRQKIHPWINRAALEYLSYSRRQEVLFGVSRYILMDIFTRGDWKEAARLDEKKLAQRLLEDERLTVLQRYRIACIYCLHEHIPQLWERLTQDEKRFSNGDGKCGFSEETHSLVLLWSYYMEEKVGLPKTCLWDAESLAFSHGNHAALMVCWDECPEEVRQDIVINRALESLRQWQSVGEFHVKRKLVSHQSPEEQSADSMKHFNLPSYYSELMFFFLSQMDQEQQWTFLKKAFQMKSRGSVLECFLDWPHQDNFLPMINRLWGIIPNDTYGQCLLALASKYSENDIKTNCDYDYRSLLRALWEDTPEEYKQYVFHDKNHNYLVINEGQKLLSKLIKRYPFQEEDEALFKRIFRYQPPEKRRAMMLFSAVGEKVCSLLMQKEKWSFLNGLLEECLSKEEIPNFKKRFIQSGYGVKLCLDAVKENRENLVEDLLDGSLESEVEKTRCKDELKDALISRGDCFSECVSLLRKGKFAEVERVINFCLLSDEKKEQFKVRFAQHVCGYLLHDYARGSWSEDCVWEQMDTIIAWSLDTEEKIRDFKKDLFSLKGIDMHFVLVFVETLWGKIEYFYQWFGLSPEEIIQLKRDTLFTPKYIKYIHENLPDYGYTNTLVDSLRWCLTDEEMVIDLQKEVEVYCTDKRKEMKKEQLDHLVSELLDGFKKEVQNKTRKEGVFVKDTGEKRLSVGIEDEFSSPRKRHRLI